ncbi:MAG: hypothetical protein U9Q71_00065, partial [Pseudomonadota bacterium]|nr:hypothetical protein [Pseudomonadota bacterium]
MIPFKTIPPSIPLAEQTPTVRLLLSIIEQQQRFIGQLQSQVEQLQLLNEQQQERIGVLEAEVARIKKLPKKPNIRPSTLPKDDDEPDDPGKGGDDASGKPNKPRKRKKNLTIHNTEVIKPDNLPEGSRLLGYEDYTVQDLLIQPYNTRYRLARYLTPDGKRLIGVLPEALQGKHFGATLESYILYQHHHQRVTQPLIRQQLSAWGTEISSGQISRILIEDKASL